jgi:hypothetical protein
MNRFRHALQHEVYLHGRAIVTTAFAIAGALMIIQMLRWIRVVVAFNLWNGFGLIVTVAGIIITSGMFGEVRSPGRRIELLLRPASTLEKVGAKLVVSTLFFLLAMTVAFLVASLTAMLVFFAIGGRTDMMVFLDGGRWLISSGAATFDFLPVHAVFFFGAIYFRRNPAGKTLLSAAGWTASYLIAAAIMIRVIFAPYLTGRYSGHGAPRAFGLQLTPDNGFFFSSRIWVNIVPQFLQDGEVAGIALRIVVILVFWGLAVLRFRETEG